MNNLTFLLSNYSPVLLQAIESTDIVNLLGAGDVTVNGIFGLIVFYLWRKLSAVEEENKTERKEREEERKQEREEMKELTQKYYDLVVLNNKVIDENTRINKRLEKILDK